jgi:hypothetical protein
MSLAVMLVLLISWAGWVLPPQRANMGLSALQMLYPFLPLFAMLELFGTLALALSLVLPSARMASMVSGVLLVGNYLLMELSNLNDDLKEIVRYTPAHFYQGGWAVNGLKWTWLAGLMGAAILLALIAWLAFLKRDIRVGGEHSWEAAAGEEEGSIKCRAGFTSRLFIWRVWKRSRHIKRTPPVFMKSENGGSERGAV